MTNRYGLFQKIATFTTAMPATTATSGHNIDLISEDIAGDKGWVYPVTSAQRLKRNRLKGGISYGGDIQMPLYPRETPSLLYYAMGKDTTTANGTLFKHVMEPDTAIHSFVASIGKDKKEHNFSGGAMKGFTIDLEVNEPVLVTFDTMFRKEEAEGDLLDITWPDFNIDERAFSGVDMEVEVDGNDVSYIESATIEYQNTIVDDNYVLGSQFLPELYVQEIEVTGTLEIGYNDFDRYELFLDEDDPSLEFEGDFGRGGDNRNLHITLKQLSFNTASLPTDSSNRYLLELEYMAERDSSGDLMEIEVLNDQSSANHIK